MRANIFASFTRRTGCNAYRWYSQGPARWRGNDGALPFPQDHFTGVAPDAEFEALAPHRPQLYAHQPLDYHG